MALNADQISALIDSGDFGALIGEVEGAEFECKAQPYQVGTESGKRELAKDVSAFANTNGGVIFLGVKTKASTAHFGDEVEEIRPFPQSLVNTSQYTDLLRAWIFPEIAGVDIRWVPTKSDASKGVVVVTIPKQAPTVGPFLITKTIDGSKSIETVFGYAARKGDRNPPLEVKELQGYLRAGFHYQEKIEERIGAIEALLKRDADHVSREVLKKGLEKTLGKRIEEAVEHGGLKARRLIVLSAQPDEPRPLRTIFSSEAGSIKKHLERPPLIRQHGWTLETLDQARIVRGEKIRVANGDRKILDLYQDGTMVFAAPADGEFLAWAKKNPATINPLALVEVIYSFMTMYQLVLLDFVEPPSHVAFGVSLLNMHLENTKSTLGPYGLQSISQMFGNDLLEAPDNNWARAITLPTKGFDPAAAAYALAREIYLWFGFEEGKIPYAKEENGIKVLSANAMIKSGN